MKFPRKAIGFISIVMLLVQVLSAAPAQKKKKKPAPTVQETANFAPVDVLVQEQVNDRAITGAVLLVGHGGRIVHQKAFGFRATVAAS